MHFSLPGLAHHLTEKGAQQLLREGDDHGAQRDHIEEGGIGGIQGSEGPEVIQGCENRRGIGSHSGMQEEVGANGSGCQVLAVGDAAIATS